MKADRLAGRLRALDEATVLMRGRADDEAVTHAAAVVQRAGARVAFSGGHTVVALAGSTGSGKSSLFNAITGTELAEATVRRPTTSKALAVSWGSQLPHELLDWLDITKRHLIAGPADRLSELVLIDLPDHDSTEASHRLTVDKLVDVVDALIWVTDPQKYADAALHRNYLAPLASHAEVMMVVLNQIDRLPPEQLDRCLSDLRRLLDSEGLRATPLMAVSALRGTGVRELREALAGTVAGKSAMARRLEADVTVAAQSLIDDLGPEAPARLNASLVEKVTRTLGDAAGVHLVVDSVRQAWRRGGAIATGWPLVSWIARIKPDPLKRLRLEVEPREHSPVTINRTSVPRATAVQQAKVDQGLRELVDHAADSMPAGWRRAVARAAHGDDAILPDRLDAAIAATVVDGPRRAWWWGLFGLLQWLLILAAAAGAVWLFAGGALQALGVPPLPTLSWYGFPAGLWLLAGGIIGGIVLALLGRLLVRWGAASRARAARRLLDVAVAAQVGEHVLTPIQAELDRYHRSRELLRDAVAD